MCENLYLQIRRVMRLSRWSVPRAGDRSSGGRSTQGITAFPGSGVRTVGKMRCFMEEMRVEMTR